MISSSSFKFLSIFTILLNSVLLGISWQGMDQKLESTLEYFNLAFFGFFLFEMIAKLIGKGFVFYFKDKMNWFDSGVIVLSAVDIGLIYGL